MSIARQMSRHDTIAEMIACSAGRTIALVCHKINSFESARNFLKESSAC